MTIAAYGYGSRADRRQRQIWPRLRHLTGTATLTTTGGAVLLGPTQVAVYEAARASGGRSTQRALAELAGVPIGSMTRALARLDGLRALFVGTLRGRHGWTVARPQRPGAPLSRVRWRSWATPAALAIPLALFADPDPPHEARAWRSWDERIESTPIGSTIPLPRICDLCGRHAPDVSPALGLEGAGFVTILRCRDHDACDERRGVIGG